MWFGLSSVESPRSPVDEHRKFEPVADPYGFIEGPVWDGSDVPLSDIPSSRIMRYDTETDACSIYREKLLVCRHVL